MIVCDICSEPIENDSYHSYCEKCDNYICSTCQEDFDENVESDGESCPFCDNEDVEVSSDELLELSLKKLGLSYEELLDEYISGNLQ